MSTAAGCAVLIEGSTALLEQCAGAFDPVVLAQLDAALAHELAIRARNRTDAAGNLADLAQFASAAKVAATRSKEQAVAATGVVLSLGGTRGGGCVDGADIGGAGDAGIGPTGLDPAVVDLVDGAALVDVIDQLERLKNAAAAVQAHAEAVFTAQQRLSQARAGIPPENLGRGVAEQIALARHESPHRGRQLCELAQVLVREMPHTMNAFITGNLSEYRASIMARETACLNPQNRAAVDALICADAEKAALMGNRQLAAAARKAACALDAAAMAKRYAKAESERYVSLRPAADGMTLLTALIPLKQGVRIQHILTHVADTAKAGGDRRGKGQIMADALMHRLIQHTPCDEGAGDHRGTPAANECPNESRTPTVGSQAPRLAALCTSVNEPDIALELIMTDRALFEGADDPAILVGHEPIPAPTARAMIHRSPADGPTGGDADGTRNGFSPRVWLKRLFTHPETNMLVAMESRGRLFPEGMKEFLRLRDQSCTTPYCGAPIREYDHIKSWAAGGQTTIANGQGLCTACNLAKEAPGWTTTHPPNGPDGPRTSITTPTGHSYVSAVPPLPGPRSSRRSNPERQ
ncbi:MAG: DUF222 domain-containing protein [Specibacter sp.]